MIIHSSPYYQHQEKSLLPSPVLPNPLDDDDATQMNPRFIHSQAQFTPSLTPSLSYPAIIHLPCLPSLKKSKGKSGIIAVEHLNSMAPKDKSSMHHLAAPPPRVLGLELAISPYLPLSRVVS